METINQMRGPRFSKSEIIPMSVVFEDLDSEARGNVIESAKRFNMENLSDNGIDIKSLCIIDGNQATINKLWLQNETASAGDYRIQLVVRNAASTIKTECNIFLEVID